MTDALVAASEIVISYGSLTALDRSSFIVPRGGITAVIGPNGSGKSSLLNAIAGITDPVSGSIDVAPRGDRRTRLAYVLQTTKVNESLPITVREVVAMGRYSTLGGYGWFRSPDRTAIAEAMARMEITDLAGRHLHELSGGQRQRVFVAQGLAQEHDLLLLDEPLTGLDLVSAQAIDDVIHDESARGGTVVMTTHDLAEARVADHVLLLAGRVIASGTPAEVLTLEHLTAAYGPNLLHVEGEQLFLDDPAHAPTAGRHVHQDRSIHIETSQRDHH